MNKPISTRLHGIVDFAAAAAMVTVPRVLGWDRRLVVALDAMAGGVVAYSLLTDYELGAVRLLPMKAHLGIDAAAAVATLALPWALGVEDDGAVAMLTGFAAFEAAVTLATRTESPVQRAARDTLNPS